MNESQHQSTFVTVVAWLFIVGAGFTLFVSAAQNILISFMPMAPVPQGSGFFVENFRLLFVLPLALSAIMLAASIGLLRRKRWAWRTFIGLLSVGVLWCAVSMLLIYFVGGVTQPQVPDGASAEFKEMLDQMEHFQRGMQLFTSAFVLGVAGLFVWIIKRLISVEIDKEFAP